MYYLFSIRDSMRDVMLYLYRMESLKKSLREMSIDDDDYMVCIFHTYVYVHNFSFPALNCLTSILVSHLLSCIQPAL